MSQAINLKEIWNKYNIWISAGVFCVLLIIVWMFVFVPLRRSLDSNLDETQQKMIDKDMYAERVVNIPSMMETRAIFAENESNLRVFLDKKSEVDFIKKIESIAEETGNKVILQIDDAETVKKAKTVAAKKTGDEIKKALPKMEYLSMSISLEGNYEQMLNFLHKIENMNYYVNVFSFDMDKDAAEATKDPFAAAEKNKPGIIALPTEVIKSNLNMVVYLEK